LKLKARSRENDGEVGGKNLMRNMENMLYRQIKLISEERDMVGKNGMKDHENFLQRSN